jgi:hypothetical protein
MEDSSTAIYINMRGDMLEFRISKDGHIDVAGRVIASIIKAVPSLVFNSSIRFDTGPPGRRNLLE